MQKKNNLLSDIGIVGVLFKFRWIIAILIIFFSITFFFMFRDINKEYKQYGYSGASDSIEYDKWTGEIVPKKEIETYSSNDKYITNSKGNQITVAQLENLLSQYEIIQGEHTFIDVSKKESLDTICNTLLREYLDLDYTIKPLESNDSFYTFQVIGDYENSYYSNFSASYELEYLVKEVFKNKYEKENYDVSTKNKEKIDENNQFVNHLILFLVFILFVGFISETIQKKHQETNMNIQNEESTEDLNKINLDKTTEESLNNMSGLEFEHYIKEILIKNGFEKVEVTKASGDFGADIIAFKEEIKYAIQCKKYNNPVGVKAIQEIMGSKAIYNCHIGVVLTNSTFTKQAVELAKGNNILLWDNNKLKELVNKANSEVNKQSQPN